MVAALSANHLVALILPTTLRRLYVARDNDPAGDRAMQSLAERATILGIEVLSLEPSMGDFNDDLRQLGRQAVTNRLRVQLAPDDVTRFWHPASNGGLL